MLIVSQCLNVCLAKAIKSMFLEENLYHICKNNAQESVEHLSLKTISKEWKHLLAKK